SALASAVLESLRTGDRARYRRSRQCPVGRNGGRDHRSPVPAPFRHGALSPSRRLRLDPQAETRAAEGRRDPGCARHPHHAGGPVLSALTRFASRLLPARADLAARGLEAQVAAARYAEGERRRVTVPLLDLTATPGHDAERATQLLHGEAFTVYDEADGFAWGQSATDHYVGYVDATGLGPPLPAPERTVTALVAHVYPAPDIKRRPLAALPFGARVAVEAEEGEFARLAEGGFLPRAALAARSADFVTAAMRFLGAPYLWG